MLLDGESTPCHDIVLVCFMTANVYYRRQATHGTVLTSGFFYTRPPAPVLQNTASITPPYKGFNHPRKVHPVVVSNAWGLTLTSPDSFVAHLI